MKIKLETIMMSYNTLSNIRDKRLPLRVGYTLSKNLALLGQEAEIIDVERRKLCEKYAIQKDGKPSITNGAYDMTPEDEIACNTEYAEFLQTKTDIPFTEIPLSLLETIDSGNYDALTPRELDALSIFITE